MLEHFCRRQKNLGDGRHTSQQTCAHKNLLHKGKTLTDKNKIPSHTEISQAWIFQIYNNSEALVTKDQHTLIFKGA